jgi:hypothetical protein
MYLISTMTHLGNFESEMRRRRTISVVSLNLQDQLNQWITTTNQESTFKLFSISVTSILNRDGFKDFMLHLTDINRPDLMEVLISGDRVLLYCSNDINRCWHRAKSDKMREVLNERIENLMDSYY